MAEKGGPEPYDVPDDRLHSHETGNMRVTVKVFDENPHTTMKMEYEQLTQALS